MNLNKNILVNNLSLKYGKTQAIQNISFQINKGLHYAFVGSSGAGKSTTIDLLLGLLEPSKGKILLDGFDLRDIEVNFSPDMTMAILTFYADGSYTQGDSEDSIAYSTRASSVWVATNNGWKTVHTNWAPYGGGSGIPKN